MDAMLQGLFQPVLKDFQFFSKWEVITRYIYDVILRHMPRHNRTTLGQNITNQIWTIEEKIVRFGYKAGPRKVLLNEIDVQLKILVRMLSLAAELKAIKYGTLAHISGKVMEMGRMLGGLKKKIQEEDED